VRNIAGGTITFETPVETVGDGEFATGPVRIDGSKIAEASSTSFDRV
jgi:hypothetical protein